MTIGLEQVLERSRELARTDRHSENLALLRDALEQYPAEAEIALRAAAAHFGEDDDQTERLARRAVVLSPQDPAVLMRAASMMLELGRTDDALELSGKARDHADEDFPLVFDLVHLGGRIALAREKPEIAEPLLRGAFDHQPESIGHGRYLAMLLESQGRLEEALEVAEEALRHWPDDRVLRRIRANVVRPTVGEVRQSLDEAAALAQRLAPSSTTATTQAGTASEAVRLAGMALEALGGPAR